MIATIHTERRGRRRHRHTLVVGRSTVIRSRSLARVLAELRTVIGQSRALGHRIERVERVIR